MFALTNRDKYLRENFTGESYIVEQLPKRENARSVSFKTGVPFEIKEQIMDAKNCPRGVLIRTFTIFSRRKRSLQKILFLNEQSKRNIVEEIGAFLGDNDTIYSLLCFSEHWMTPAECESKCIKSNNYMIKPYIARNRGYGGSIVFFRDGLTCSGCKRLVQLSSPTVFEISAVTMVNLLILCIHC